MMHKGLIVCLFLMGGNLNDGAQDGSAYLNLNNGPGNANWNIGGRNCGKCETI